MNKRAIVALLSVLAVTACLSYAQEASESIEDVATVGQTGWRWCSKCEGMHFITNGLGPCPAGGTHDVAGSSLYKLINNDFTADGQHWWRYCKKCKGLFYGGHETQGVCPAGGAHDSSWSGDYCVIHNSTAAPGQQNWRWCSRCEGLFYGGHASLGTCPAGGQHSLSGSGNYTLLFETKDAVVWGRVTDSSAAPVAKASVKIQGKAGTKTMKSATDGSYGFAGLKQGKYTFTASKKNVGDAKRTARLQSGDAKSVALVLKKK
ncbi:MAG: carboxypeptidase-like regulatory domain-containing protein [Acidobacteriota bacterium]